jgi:hypothetical protein
VGRSADKPPTAIICVQGFGHCLFLFLPNKLSLGTCFVHDIGLVFVRHPGFFFEASGSEVARRCVAVILMTGALLSTAPFLLLLRFSYHRGMVLVLAAWSIWLLGAAWSCYIFVTVLLYDANPSLDLVLDIGIYFFAPKDGGHDVCCTSRACVLCVFFGWTPGLAVHTVTFWKISFTDRQLWPASGWSGVLSTQRTVPRDGQDESRLHTGDS